MLQQRVLNNVELHKICDEIVLLPKRYRDMRETQQTKRVHEKV